MRNITIFFTLLFFTTILSAQDSTLQRLKNELTMAHHDTLRIIKYCEIAIYFQDNVEKIDSALFYAEKAEQLAKQYPNFPKISKLWNTLGRIYSVCSNNTFDNDKQKHYNSLAQYYYKQAMQDAKRLNDQEYFIKAWLNLNIVLFDDSTYIFFESSFRLINYIEAKTYFNRVDSIVLSKMYISLCENLDHNISLPASSKYIAAAKKLVEKGTFAAEQLELIDFYKNMHIWNKLDEQKLLDKYNILKNTFKYPMPQQELEHSLAYYYFNIGEYEKCLFLSHKFRLSEGLDSVGKLANIGINFMNIGRSYYMLNKNNNAIKYLIKAKKHIDIIKTGLMYEKYLTYLYLSKAYEKQGNYKAAHFHIVKADSLYKSLNDKQIQILMAQSDVALEQIQQDKKVQEAQTQILLQEQEAKIQRQQKNIFLLLFVAAIISMAWALYNYKKYQNISKDLVKKTEQLQESNLVKDKIFALLSHDLRTPINRLLGNIDKSVGNITPNIKPELKNMQDILNNVLYWASMQLKGAIPIFMPTPLRNILDSIIEEYQYNITEKEITLINTVENKIVINTDENYLKIIFRNLINNAIKFTNSKGYIYIEAKNEYNNLQVSIRDTGVGIQKDKLKNIFNLPKPTQGTNHEKGTGLGLSLSLEIAKKLNANIKLKSREGEGTKVILDLPI